MELQVAIGGTAAIRLQRLAEGAAEVWLKLEGGNPGGSIKDRAAWGMLAAAEERGEILPGKDQVVVEATSGNTGIALAMLAAVRGYRYLNVSSASLSPERRAILRAYGAELEFVPAAQGISGARERARTLAAETGGWWADQFSNPDNPLAHERSTAPEAWRQLEGRVDALVLGTGTGGSLSGMARFLRRQNPALQVVALEPEACRALLGGPCEDHPFAGIGPGFVPENLDLDLIDEVVAVAAEPALLLGGRLAREEGLLLGPSAMANVWGALQVARRLGPGRRVLTVAPDSGLKYLTKAPYSRGFKEGRAD